MAGPPLLYSTYTTNPDATVDAHVLSLLSATSPLSYNSATGQFTIQQASGAQAGYLSAADWTTFSGKQNALSLPLSIANGGTNNAGPFTAGSVIFSNGTLLTQNNPLLFWDDTNSALCVGTNVQNGTFTVAGKTPISGNAPFGMYVAGGNGVNSTVGTVGGPILIACGHGGSGSAGAGGPGGDFTIQATFGGDGTSGNGASNKGGAFNASSGAGGNRTGGTTPAGTGGALNFIAGGGGNNTSTGLGGTGGTGTFTAGAGGSSAASNGGAGGSMIFKGGPGGTGFVNGGAGGNVQFIPGAGSGSAAGGVIIFGNATGQTMNFIAGAGAGVPVNGVTPAAWIACQRNGVAGFIPWYQ